MGGWKVVFYMKEYIICFLSRREQKLKVREQVKALNEVEQMVRERLNSDAVEGHDRTAKPVYSQVLGREKQVKIMNKVEHVVGEKLNSNAVEGSDRTAKPVFDKEMARKNQVEMLNDRQVEQEMMGVGRQLSRPEFQFVIDN